MASLGFEHVSKRYGRVTALSDFTLRVRDGEFLVVLGPSGCGKSTLLRIAAGLERVSEGRVLIGDQDVTRVPPRDRDVAMVFQENALYPHLTGYGNLSFGLQARGLARSAVEARVGSTGLALGLRALLGRKPAQLSGGEQQQVALGRAVVRRPRVFLLDQPLAAVDGAARARMRDYLRHLHGELRATFVLATHEQTDAMVLGDRIAAVDGGRLQQLGSPRALYEHPANLWVAGFVGSPPMNFLPVRVDGRRLLAAAFELELPWAPAVDRAVLGVRPEHLLVTGPEEPGVDLAVDSVEEQGAHRVVRGRLGPDAVAVRVDRDLRTGPGESIRVRVDPEQVHLFEAAGGRALL